MEDILASIRRIIADDEPVDAGLSALPQFPAAPASPVSGQGRKPDAGQGSAAPAGPAPFPHAPGQLGPRDPQAMRPAATASGNKPNPFQTRPTSAARSDKHRLSGYSAVPAANPAPSPAPTAAPRPAENREDEVFELTDELILGGEKENAEPRAEAQHRDASIPQAPQRAAPPSPQASRFPPDDNAASQPPGFWPRGRAAEAAPMPLPPFSADSPSFSKPERAPRLDAGLGIAPDSRWPGDFQAPVPEGGPHAAFGADPDMPEIEDGPMVAETVGRLAKSAVSALDDGELAEAHRVNFRNLKEESRSAVAQSFARAVGQNEGFLNPFAAPGNEDARPPEMPGEDMPPFPARAPSPAAASRGPSNDAPPPAVTPLHPSPVRAQRGAPLPAAPFAAPPVTPLSPQAGRTLEDSVREMLRPLLVEWLNANMPRILEDAIRQEIRTRGLPWDAGGKS
jgi:cell pole-organizing protein PopZ